MDKKELRREKLEQELSEEEYREQHTTSYCIKFKGVVYVDAIDKSEAVDKAKDKQDLYDYVDEWNVD